LTHYGSKAYLHVRSEPVLSDSVVSTPVVGYCVAGNNNDNNN